MSEQEQTQRRGTSYRVYNRDAGNRDLLVLAKTVTAFSSDEAILKVADREGTWIAVPARNWTEHEVKEAPPEAPRFRIVRDPEHAQEPSAPEGDERDASQVAADLLASGEATVVPVPPGESLAGDA